MEFTVEGTSFRGCVVACITFVQTRKITSFWGLPDTIRRREGFLDDLEQIIQNNPNDDSLLVNKVREITRSPSLNRELFASFYRPFNKILEELESDNLNLLKQGVEFKYSQLSVSLSEVQAMGELSVKNKLITELQAENQQLSIKAQEQSRALVIVERSLANTSLENQRLVAQSRKLLEEYSMKLEEASKRHETQLKIIAQRHDAQMLEVQTTLESQINLLSESKDRKITELTEELKKTEKELEKEKSGPLMGRSLTDLCEQDFFNLGREPKHRKKGSEQVIQF